MPCGETARRALAWTASSAGLSAALVGHSVSGGATETRREAWTASSASIRSSVLSLRLDGGQPDVRAQQRVKKLTGKLEPIACEQSQAVGPVSSVFTWVCCCDHSWGDRFQHPGVCLLRPLLCCGISSSRQRDARRRPCIRVKAVSYRA